MRQAEGSGGSRLGRGWRTRQDDGSGTVRLSARRDSGVGLPGRVLDAPAPPARHSRRVIARRQSRASVRHFAAPPDLMNSDSPSVCGAYPSCSNLPIVTGLPSGMTTCFPIQTALQANRTASSSETAILFAAGMRSMIAACPSRSNAPGNHITSPPDNGQYQLSSQYKRADKRSNDYL